MHGQSLASLVTIQNTWLAIGVSQNKIGWYDSSILIHITFLLSQDMIEVVYFWNDTNKSISPDVIHLKLHQDWDFWLFWFGYFHQGALLEPK